MWVFNFIKTTFNHGVYEMRKIGRGFRTLYNDVLIAAGMHKKGITEKYKKEKYHEKVKLRQVKKDVFKFIPFSFFILIPGAELLLPPFLMVFPNSVPSQFMSEKARNDRFMMIKSRREEAAKKLQMMLPGLMYKLEKDE